MLSRLIVDGLDAVLRSGQRVARTTAEILERADLGMGPLRLTPATAERLRRFWAARVREALEVPHADELPAATADGRGTPGNTSLGTILAGDAPERPSPDARLRQRMERLLRRSADPDAETELHPAFLSIVDELCPDEARILRLLRDDGPQPTVNVVASPRIGRGDTLIAEHLSMIGARAGCRDTAATPVYVANLERLGIIRIHDEELVGHDDYELIEVGAQASELEEHIRDERNQRARFVHRTARLSPLGEAFCQAGLPQSSDM